LAEREFQHSGDGIAAGLPDCNERLLSTGLVQGAPQDDLRRLQPGRGRCGRVPEDLVENRDRSGHEPSDC
jgi:hypothetical protein